MRKLALFCLIFCALSLIPVDSRAAVVDQGFDPNANDQVLAIATQPDGKTIVGGLFTSIAGVTRNHLARLNADGTVDTAFDPHPNNLVWAIAVQPDGKIIVGGPFSSIAGVTRSYLARLNSDGTFDSSFTSNPNAPPEAIVVQPDRKIIISGGFASIGSVTRHLVARLHPNGSLDTGFADPFPSALYGAHDVKTIALQPDGRILAGGGLPGATAIVRLLSDGTLDSSFNQSVDYVEAIALQPDGKIIVGGYFLSVGGVSTSCVVRLYPNGSLDTGFTSNVGQGVTEIAIQPDGKIVVGGDFYEAAGEWKRQNVVRLKSDGSLDAAAFKPGDYYCVDDYVYAIALQPDGKILLGGRFTKVAGAGMAASEEVTRNRIARFNPDGSLEVPFNPNVFPTNSVVSAVALQPDGKILIGGDFTSIEGVARSGIARLNCNGSLDTTFNPGAFNGVSAIAIQPDGNIVIGGSFTTGGGAPRNRLARLKPDGSLDTTFATANPDEAVNAIALQKDGKILVGGYFSTIGGGTRGRVARLDSNGSLDTTFSDPTANNYVMTIAIQPDGKTVVGGSFNTIGGETRNGIARLNSDGTLDTTFTSSANNFVYAIALQPDGRIVIGGSFNSVGGVPKQGLARLSSTGGLDGTFNSSADYSVFTMALQPDDKIVIGGSFANVGGQVRHAVARINSNGSLDTTVNVNVQNGWVLAVALQPDGRVVMGGSFWIELTADDSIYRLARLADAGTATQDLRATPNRMVIIWNRSGAGPELAWTTFETSTDQSAWSLLNYGHRVGAEPIWDLAGLNLPPDQNFYIRARGYYSDGHSYSILESLRLFYLTDRPPVILSHPVSATVTEGNNVSFSSTADGYPTPTVKWQVNAGSGWTDIAGATSTTYTHTALASENNYQYRAVFTNSEGSIASDPATLKVMRNQTISITQHAPSSAAFNANFTVTATASSGLGVQITSSGVCTGNGTGSATINITSASGTCTVHYNQPGNTLYNPAPELTESTTAEKAAQTIDFAALADRILGDPPFTVSATASSSLAVSFSSRTLPVCSVSGTTVTLLSPGPCTVRASQAGNANYSPAPDVDRSFGIANFNPSAADDHYDVSSGQTITKSAPGVLANDTDANGDALTAVQVSGPAHASSFTLNSDGSFTYTHDGTLSGDDSFTYTAGDPWAGESGTATVTLHTQSEADTDLSVTPSTRLFGVEELTNCASSTPVLFTVKNSSAGSRTLGALHLDGPSPDQFALGPDNCSGQALASGSSCTVQVKLCPTSVGSKAARLLIPSNDPETPVLMAFLHNYESKGEEARRRLPPVLFTLSVPEEMTEGVTYTLSWSLLGYGESYLSNLVFFNCDGITDGSCGGSYGNHFDESGDLAPESSEPGEWTYSGVRSTKFNYTHSFTAPLVSQDTSIVIRLYSKHQADDQAGKESLSLLIPGNLSLHYYDSEGRRLLKVIKSQ